MLYRPWCRSCRTMEWKWKWERGLFPNLYLIFSFWDSIVSISVFPPERFVWEEITYINSALNCFYIGDKNSFTTKVLLKNRKGATAIIEKFETETKKKLCKRIFNSRYASEREEGWNRMAITEIVVIPLWTLKSIHSHLTNMQI